MNLSILDSLKITNWMKKVTNKISYEYWDDLNIGYDNWFKTPFSSYVRQQQFKRFQKFTKGCQKYLEIGSGTGEFISKVECSYKIGIDISEKMIDIGRGRSPDTQFYVCPSHQLPFEDNSFDCVCMMNVFQYLESPEETLKELYRVTMPKGEILFTVFSKMSLSLNPLRYILRRKTGEKLPLVNFYNQSQIKKMLYGKDFKIYGSGIRLPFESRLLYNLLWGHVQKFEDSHRINPILTAEMVVHVFK